MTGLSLPLELWEDATDDTEALLEEWLVAVGDRVVTGQVLATAVIVKTNVELLASCDGVITAILVPAGETFARGADLATLAPAGAPASAQEPAPAAPAAPPTPAPTPAQPAPEAARVVPFTGLRGSIARNLSAAWQAPRVAAGVEVDMSAAQARLRALRAEGGERRITLTALFVRAAALALRAHPQMNALVTEHGVERVPGVHIAIAVSLDAGLVTPVIRDADMKPAASVAHELAELASTARAAGLAPGALQGGTFTVSNLGGTGIDWFTPVLNPPQAGILGVSRVADRPVVRNGSLAVAPCTTLTLVFDHRAIDGEPAGRFLANIRDLLEEPAQL
jgi:pyruvate dehydrogenase E2 component (dihydrolipoamide acetyltransferase)